EIETDKVTVEIESPASGVLSNVTAQEGDVIPVGQTIALIAEPGAAPAASTLAPQGRGQGEGLKVAGARAEGSRAEAIKASPLARRIAEEHGVDLARIKSASGKIEKADVLAFVESRKAAPTNGAPGGRLVAASPKARRLAAERGVELAALRGSGPGGAVLTVDVPVAPGGAPPSSTPLTTGPLTLPSPQRGEGVGTVWRIMAERMTASWKSAPHFYLVREVNVARLQAWLGTARKQTGAHVTYSDLLVKLVAATLAQHPRVNVSWKDGSLERHTEINIGLAVALEDGLVVPVIAHADTLGLKDIAARREDLVARAQAGKLRPADVQGGVFTISNLGMFGVDAFSAIVNPPQAAILAVGRIADRVVPVNGQPAVQPTMTLTLSCDHRALDGARGAQFLGALADLIEEPLALLT
ncbi:MAG TPA: dihydrolipoamide acetyltransferase family protein, partial [Methylomirabilota bacterium]|nr:dihydrolipoamide acetyltransferase family protein [Methylomirabilota bacterium]